jgi:saccharopine dehydrogenase-like NADP-dependent oxidoreductase
LKILVVGAGRIGSKVIKQLKKSTKIRFYTIDPRENPQALEQEIVEKIDFSVDLIPGEIIKIINDLRPDLVLVTTSKEDISKTGVQGIDILVESLNNELESASEYPIISVSRNE